MRRAWLLALLLSPAIAAAQTPGTIVFDDTPRTATDGFINAAECDGSQLIALDWTISLTTDVFPGTGVTYTLYAANKDTTGDCPVRNGDKGDASLLAGAVGALTGQTTQTVLDATFSTSVIAARAGKGTCDATADEDIFLCVQGSSSGNVGIARGKLTLSLSAPPAPSGFRVEPGERALNLFWTDVTSSTPAVAYYVVEATSFDPTAPGSVDPRDTVTHTGTFDTSRNARLTDLVNDVTYRVRIWSLTAADNRSTTFAEASGRAENVLDFWEWYSLDGREQGGCAGGPAGLASLLLAAGVLAALRRRK